MIQVFSEIGVEAISKISIALIRNQRISQAIFFMNKLFTTNNTANCLVLHHEGQITNLVRLHYLTFCLELYLEAGVELVPLSEYDKFAIDYFSDMSKNSDDTEWKFFTLMFVLNTRQRNWFEAEKWRSGVSFMEEITDKYYNQFTYDSMYSLFKYLEGLLVSAALNPEFILEGIFLNQSYLK